MRHFYVFLTEKKSTYLAHVVRVKIHTHPRNLPLPKQALVAHKGRAGAWREKWAKMSEK
jgi:hypothetical protein